MENELAALSNELAAAVEQAGRAVVAVNARPRFASSGVLWRPGIVVTAEHAIRGRDDEAALRWEEFQRRNSPENQVGSVQ